MTFLSRKGKEAFLVVLALGLVACSNNDRTRQLQNAFTSNAITPFTGRRVAAVVTIPTGRTTAVQNSTLQQPNLNNNRTSLLPPIAGTQGRLEILSIDEDETTFVGIYSNVANLPTGYAGSGIRGRRTSFGIPIAGLSRNSRMEFTKAGLLFVTLSKSRELLPVPIYSTGASGFAQPFRLSGEPTNLAVAETENYGEVIIIVTKGGLDFFDVSAIDIRTGTGVPRYLRSRFQPLRPGIALDVAWLPGGEWFMVAHNPVPGANIGGGNLILCHFPTVMGESQNALVSLASQGYGRGCFPGDPRLVTGETGWPGNPLGYGVGTQQVPGVPMKLAINETMGVYLSKSFGPCRFETPAVGEMNEELDAYLPIGCLENFSNYGTPRNRLQQSFGDVEVYNTTILATDRQFLYSYATDNEFEFGQPLAGPYKFEGRLTDLAVDESGDARFLLVGEDNSRNSLDNVPYKVWIGYLDGITVRPPTDFIPLSGEPVAIAIRPRVEYPSAPFADAGSNTASSE